MHGCGVRSILLPAVQSHILGPTGRANIIAGFRCCGFWPFDPDVVIVALQRTFEIRGSSSLVPSATVTATVVCPGVRPRVTWMSLRRTMEDGSNDVMCTQWVVELERQKLLDRLFQVTDPAAPWRM